MKEVIKFWFEELKPEDWFKKSDALDQEMRVRFEELYWKASRGELFSWRTSAQGRLAEILLLDQIPRNIFRGTAQAFMTDSLALVLAQEGLTQAQELPVVQRGFFYMPFMHSESLTIHEEALRLFDQPGLEKRLKYEKMHMDILQQFGRYPHRNAILGRPSTKEEEKYLKEHSGF